MNENYTYTYSKGTIIIENDLGDYKNIVYTDHFRAIILKEEELKILRETSGKVNAELMRMNNNDSSVDIWKSMVGAIVFASIGLLVTLSLVLLVPILIAIGVIGGLYVVEAKEKKKQKGLRKQKQFIDSSMNEVNNNLKKLTTDKVRDKEAEIAESFGKKPGPRPLNIKKELNRLRNMINLYYEIGANDIEYYSYLKSGELGKNEETRHYNAEELEIIKKTLRDSVKRKKKTK